MAEITILDYSSNPWYKGFKMAISVFDYNTNQWYVQHADGELEPCHNRATANYLARLANETPKETVQLMDYDALYELGYGACTYENEEGEVA